MKFKSNFGSIVPKLICVIALLSLAAFFMLGKRAELPGETDYNNITPQRLDQTDESNHPSPHNNASTQTTPDSSGDYKGSVVNTLPFSITIHVPEEGTEEEGGLHFYFVNVPLEKDMIVDIDLQEPKGADLALSVINVDEALLYSNETKNGGNEGIRYVVTENKPITVAVETITAPMGEQPGQYTLTITPNPQERGYIIESLPFTVSRPITGQEKLHLYQTSSPVDKGTIVEARLKPLDGAELSLYITDDGGDISTSESTERGEEEAALTLYNGGIATVIIEVKSEEEEEEEEDKYGSYNLTVNTKGKKHLIETLPYTTSGHMSKEDAVGENWHWYQITTPVPAGSVISANLSVNGEANMDVTIFVDQANIAYGADNGIGGNERTELSVENDSKVYVIVDNVEGEGDYSLTVTSIIPFIP